MIKSLQRPLSLTVLFIFLSPACGRIPAPPPPETRPAVEAAQSQPASGAEAEKKTPETESGPFEKAGHEMKEGFKKTGSEIKKGAKKVGSEIKGAFD